MTKEIFALMGSKSYKLGFWVKKNKPFINRQ